MFYPSRIPVFNSTEYNQYNLNLTEFKDGGLGRSASVQANYQLASIATTLALAISSGFVTALILRSPLFKQITDEKHMFTDKADWILPADFDKDTILSNPITNDSVNSEVVDSIQSINSEVKINIENN